MSGESIANDVDISLLGDDVKNVYDNMRYALKIGGRLWILAQAFEWRELVIFFPEISAKKFTDKVWQSKSMMHLDQGFLHTLSNTWYIMIVAT